MTSPEYTIQFYYIDVDASKFVQLDEITTYQSLSYEVVSDGVGYLVFNMNLRDPKCIPGNLTSYRTKVLLLRNNVPVWYGFIYKRILDTQGENLSIVCHTQLKWFERRLINSFTTFSNEDASDIIWDLIDTDQSKTSGEMMLRRGTIRTTTNKDRTYPRYTVLKKAIENFSFVDRPVHVDFIPQYNSTTNKLTQVNVEVWKQRGSIKNGIVLEIDDTIDLFSATDQTTLYNQIYAIGAGTGEEVTSTSSGSISSQKFYGLQEATLNEKSISLKSTLNAKVQRVLVERSLVKFDLAFRIKPTSNITYNSFYLDDIIKYDLTTTNILFLNEYGKGTAKVKRIEVSIDNVGTEFITPYIELKQ